MMNLLYKDGSYPHCMQNRAIFKANVKADVKASNFNVYEVN
jgi:hypothetical protein